MTVPSCKREGCPVAATGKCLEGFSPLSDCPYIVLDGAPESQPDRATASFHKLPNGTALDSQSAAKIARSSRTRMVVLAGPPDSGKTTILASLYESFVDAPFANYLFAGSESLLGFERRCHEGRVISGRSTPDMLRTPLTDGVEFLHLGVAPATVPDQHLQLLLADISGERFNMLMDSSAAVASMPILRRVDHLCVVVDGEQLVQPARRHAAINSARMLIRSIIEENALHKDCAIQLALTKWDLVVALHKDDSPRKIANEVHLALGEVAGIHGVELFEIAARPREPGLPFAYGLPTLFRRWTADQTIDLRLAKATSLDSNSRQSLRFGRFSSAAWALGVNGQ